MVCDRSIIIKINKVLPMLAFPEPSSSISIRMSLHHFIGLFASSLGSGPGGLDASGRTSGLDHIVVP